MYAMDPDGRRVQATPGADASCPTCTAPLMPKCGQIIARHWSHHGSPDCDPWAEPDSTWHRAWQQRVPRERRELTRGPHRADIITPGGTVVELQHSPISPEEITERENFYGRMVWLFDATEPYAADRLLVRHRHGDRGPYYTFRWKHPRKSIAHCRKPVYLDLGGLVLRVCRVYPAAPCGGWGRLGTVDRFVAWLNGETEDQAA